MSPKLIILCFILYLGKTKVKYKSKPGIKDGPIMATLHQNRALGNMLVVSAITKQKAQNAREKNIAARDLFTLLLVFLCKIKTPKIRAIIKMGV